MKLKSYRVRNFKSIQDSRDIEVDDRITCFVGMNESGKTVLLEALYRTNPVKDEDSVFDEDLDYPKRNIKSRKARDSTGGDDEPVVECSYKLEEDDIKEVAKAFGDKVITGAVFKRKTYYNNRIELSSCDIVDEQAAKVHLADKTELSDKIIGQLKNSNSWEEFVGLLISEQSDKAKEVHKIVSRFQGQDFSNYILEQIIWPRAPKFFYLDDYSQIKDYVNLTNLAQQGYSDHLIVSFVKLAELNYKSIVNATNRQQLENSYGGDEGLEKASKNVTSKILTHWSQNKNLRIRINIGFAGQSDLEEMKNGPNIWINIRDDDSDESTLFSSRSKGFLWFFSFLVQYASIKQQHEKVILLLDEPGLHLHGYAQWDLLKSFEQEFTDTQLIYTTHSPFMVDMNKTERIQAIHNSSDNGTEVSSNALRTKGGAPLPLQAALGYGITQSLFIAPNCLIVEGRSDMLFLQAISAKFSYEKRAILSPRWVITPVGGIGKVPAFLSLFGSQKDMNVVVLVDANKEHKQSLENLYKKEELIVEEKVLTYAYFLGDPNCKEADIEDMFEPDFYISLINESFSNDLGKEIDIENIKKSFPRPRIVKSIEAHLAENPFESDECNFNHRIPAVYFSKNIDRLWKKMSDESKEKFEKMFERINSLLK